MTRIQYQVVYVWQHLEKYLFGLLILTDPNSIVALSYQPTTEDSKCAFRHLFELSFLDWKHLKIWQLFNFMIFLVCVDVFADSIKLKCHPFSKYWSKASVLISICICLFIYCTRISTISYLVQRRFLQWTQKQTYTQVKSFD